MRQRPLRADLAELPTAEELEKEIEKLKRGREGGESSILPEMVKVACIGDEFLKRLLELVHDVWKEKSVPSDWRDAILIPIPKKGDLSHCHNWRGISLLDVIGKIVAIGSCKKGFKMSCPSRNVDLGKGGAVPT